MIPVLGIPHYNRPDLLLRCINSIDHPVDRLVIVQNGPDDQMPQITKPDYVRELIQIRHPNAGVAAAWNEIITLFTAPWWFISNNDIQFGPGNLGLTAKVISENTFGLAMGQYEYASFAITAACTGKVGLFDINFFPAYYEDADYSHRARIAGVPIHQIPYEGMIHGVDGNVSSTLRSDSRMKQSIEEAMRLNNEYYIAKWGGHHGREVYVHPFNNPHLNHRVWAYSPEHRARLHQIMETK